MTTSALRMRKSIAGFTVAVAMLIASGAAAQEGDSHDAAKHFQRGVALYGETDYRAALVEFKRAYAIAPNVAVLYNVGEAEYQLQEYANALTTFERYLAQSPAADGRRGEIESTVEVLRARVGRLTVTTSPAGAEVAVDDQLVGKTPLEESILVSVGHRKVTVSLAGRQTTTRYVDVAADDTVPVSIAFPSVSDGASAVPAAHLSATLEPAAPSHSASTWRTVGWVATGAFAAGAIGFGALTLKASGDLSSARSSFPTTADTLNKDSNAVKTYGMVADALTAAAVVVGGITLYSTLAATPRARPEGPSARVWLGPASAHLAVVL